MSRPPTPPGAAGPMPADPAPKAREAARSTWAQRSAAPGETGASPPPEPVAVPRRGHFEGLLTFRGAASVQGTLTGSVAAHGLLRIGPDALVEADIAVDELIVEGFLRGDVRASRRIELGPRARVEGRLDAPRVAFQEGCRFRGDCRSGHGAGATDLP